MAAAPWICLQIGAREHYAVPRALQQIGLLDSLLTDAWVVPRSLRSNLLASQSFQSRYHPQLNKASVFSPKLGSLAFEALFLIPGFPREWPRILARNAWFQRWCLLHIWRFHQQGLTMFSYSYAARSVFLFASQRGWRTVLGQIDPGPEEEQIVIAEHSRYPQLASSWKPAPPRYWQHWEEELKLADSIVVNSPWSRDCLLRRGVPAKKLKLIPLVYETFADSTSLPPLPASPFQLLFLGTIGLRKGIGRLLEAMRLLESQDVQLTLAGPSELDPQAWAGRPNIRWLGRVPRSQVAGLYGQAHAMILPTLSDGFAITQLEALAHGCPVIASRFCGEVVTPGLNGWLLASLEPKAIAATILEAMDTAHFLPRPLQRPAFGLPELADALQQLSLPTVCP